MVDDIEDGGYKPTLVLGCGGTVGGNGTIPCNVVCDDGGCRCGVIQSLRPVPDGDVEAGAVDDILGAAFHPGPAEGDANGGVDKDS